MCNIDDETLLLTDFQVDKVTHASLFQRTILRLDTQKTGTKTWYHSVSSFLDSL